MKFTSLLALSFCVLSIFFTLQVHAESTEPIEARSEITAPAPSSKTVPDEKEWSLELGSGLLIADVRTDLPGYTIVPADMTASFKLDDDTMDNFASGILRGHTEFIFRGFGYTVIHGTESRFVGASFGPRYNFVQPGWKWVPFVEGNVGFAFTDSQGVTVDRGQIGQGQDFCFNFGIAMGVRYDITNDWFVRLSGMYTHFSNGGLSSPDRKNRALDAAGPELSFGHRF